MNVIMINTQRNVIATLPCRDCPERTCCALFKDLDSAKNEKVKQERTSDIDRDVPSYRHAEIF